MTKKEPQIAHQDNLKSLLSFVELDTDIESEQCRKLAEQLKYFYFDHLKSNIQPQLTHFTVPNHCSCSDRFFFTFIFDAVFYCRYYMTKVLRFRHIKWLHIETHINTPQHICCDLISIHRIVCQNECLLAKNFQVFNKKSLEKNYCHVFSIYVGKESAVLELDCFFNE